jgi:hypothetical protein
MIFDWNGFYHRDIGEVLDSGKDNRDTRQS